MTTIGRIFVSTLPLALCLALCGASSEGFHGDRKSSLRSKVDGSTFQKEVQVAMGEALGCGGEVSAEHLDALEKELEPIWKTLPKNEQGRIESRSLRFLAFRHFNGKFSLVLRGFEPSRASNSSSWGGADILSQQVPAFVESVLESRHATVSGLDLRDAAQMVAALEQLIFDSESGLLSKVYEEQHKPTNRPVGAAGLVQLLESYLVHWLMGDDKEGIALLLNNRTLLETAFPHWDQLTAFAKGQIRSFQHLRQRQPERAAKLSHGHGGGNALAAQYSFDDAHAIVGDITRNFASFWESECITMKETLFAMDTHRTGRVPLSRFYSSALETDWRFGESEAYLREVGALDETSWRGKQVIIPNYLQAASNCIVSAPHYMVCCASDCETITREVEAAIGAPVASPEQLLEVVGNISSSSSLDDDRLPELRGALTLQLQGIAATHGGQVPLHGRLFAQWLHFAFPRECPFPHKSGTANVAKGPTEFGDAYVATDEEMRAHAAEANATLIPITVPKDELQWMSQWSEEEELIADYAGVLRGPRWSRPVGIGAALLVIASLFGLVGLRHRQAASDAMLLPTHRKSHCA